MSRAGRKFAQRLEDIEQRIVGVRVIDKDLKLPLRRNGFETAGHLRRSREAENRFAQINAQRCKRRRERPASSQR